MVGGWPLPPSWPQRLVLPNGEMLTPRIIGPSASAGVPAKHSESIPKAIAFIEASLIFLQVSTVTQLRTEQR
jgi:hypothetical protein